MNICTKIVTRVGRRIDESAAGRRPPAGRQPRQHHHPAAGDRRRVDLDPQVLQEGLDHLDTMAHERQHLAGDGDVAEDRGARCRLNILISGGTGSGKTTLLNALSR
jgi:pilus assembly protein CpaF